MVHVCRKLVRINQKKTHRGFSGVIDRNNQSIKQQLIIIISYRTTDFGSHWTHLRTRKNFDQLDTEMLRNCALNKPARLHIFVLPRDLLQNGLCGVFIRLPQVWPHPPSLTAPVTNTSRCRHDRVHVRSSKRYFIGCRHFTHIMRQVHMNIFAMK